ncbi:MAG: hypothetical protein ICV54_30805 [Nostoc sp. C3-bin3]|nr:hypothetical protein [Nostoc sp. C3-bin3]
MLLLPIHISHQNSQATIGINLSFGDRSYWATLKLDYPTKEQAQDDQGI